MSAAAELVQGSVEWHLARCGKVTASRISDLMAQTKSGWGASRANYMAELIAERLTGVPADSYSSPAMKWGTETEPQARAAYQFYADLDVVETGFASHPRIADTGASPDGLVGDDGLVELKCPNTATHIETLLGGSVPSKYVLQMQWQMACTGRTWCDFASFDPRMPENMRLFVRRLERNATEIGEIERRVVEFLGELQAKIDKLRAAVA